MDGVVSFFVFDFVALLGTIYPVFLRHFHPVVADRRATARTTVTLSHAATSQKKRMAEVLTCCKLPPHPTGW